MIYKISDLFRRFFWSSEKYARFMGVKIGLGCNIQNVNFGSEPFLVEIGDHVQITDGTKIFTHGGAWIFRHQYPKLDFFGKVVIKDNVYIGNNTIILPGVTIGKDVIIGAGSVITKSIEDGKIVAGNPARIIADSQQFIERIKMYDLSSKGMSYKEKREYLLSLPDDRFIKKKFATK